jgi:hypothetical protein
MDNSAQAQCLAGNDIGKGLDPLLLGQVPGDAQGTVLAQVPYRICVRVIVGNHRTPCGQEVPGERETDVTPGAGDQDSGFQHQMAHPNGWVLALRPIR